MSEKSNRPSQNGSLPVPADDNTNLEPVDVSADEGPNWTLNWQSIGLPAETAKDAFPKRARPLPQVPARETR